MKQRVDFPGKETIETKDRLAIIQGQKIVDKLAIIQENYCQFIHIFKLFFSRKINPLFQQFFWPWLIAKLSIVSIFSVSGKSNRCFNNFFQPLKQRLNFLGKEKIENMDKLGIIQGQNIVETMVIFLEEMKRLKLWIDWL